MPAYLYQAKKGPVEVINSRIDASSKEEAVAKINSSGLFLVWIKEEKGARKMVKRVSLKTVVEFTKQLSTLVNSGSPLASALNTLAFQTEQAKLKPVLLDIIDQVKDGHDFSFALSKHQGIFPTLYVSLVKIGETSGTLGENLNRLSGFLEEDMDFRNSIVSAMIYPCLVLAVGIGAVFMLLKFVIPELVVIFEDTGQVLPLPTLLLVKLSNFTSRFGIYILGLTAIAIIGVKEYLKNLENRVKLDSIVLKLPLIGKLLRKIEICHFSRTLSILIRNSVPIDAALKVLSQSIKNLFIRRKISGLEEDIRGGNPLNIAMRKIDVFDSSFIDVVTVGESSGRLGEVLEGVSIDYGKDVNRIMKNLMSLFEPILILGIAIVVGFIVLSMLLPIFQMDFNL